MWGDGSDDETGTFCPDLLSLVSKCAHQMDAYGVPKGRCGATKANGVPLRQMVALKGKWGAEKAYGAPYRQMEHCEACGAP